MQLGEAERWLPVVGYEGLYEVSDKGRVRSIDRCISYGKGRTMTKRGVELKSRRSPSHPMHYREVHLSANGRKRWLRVHKLVLTAFKGHRPSEQGGRHLDGDTENNSLTNLTWGTQQQNIQDSIGHGTFHNSAKNRCKRGHDFTPENTYRNPRGFRQCRQCIRGARGVRSPLGPRRAS